jgi:hypothetical protein
LNNLSYKNSSNHKATTAQASLGDTVEGCCSLGKQPNWGRIQWQFNIQPWKITMVTRLKKQIAICNKLIQISELQIKAKNILKTIDNHRC